MLKILECNKLEVPKKCSLLHASVGNPHELFTEIGDEAALLNHLKEALPQSAVVALVSSKEKLTNLKRMVHSETKVWEDVEIWNQDPNLLRRLEANTLLLCSDM